VSAHLMDCEICRSDLALSVGMMDDESADESDEVAELDRETTPVVLDLIHRSIERRTARRAKLLWIIALIAVILAAALARLNGLI
jgi:hypothetical protein